MSDGSPLQQQILFDILLPPIAAVAFRILARGWAGLAQGGRISDVTHRRQSREFWIILIVLYLFAATTFIYAHFIKGQS
jgi:hypothetical protein